MIRATTTLVLMAAIAFTNADMMPSMQEMLAKRGAPSRPTAGVGVGALPQRLIGTFAPPCAEESWFDPEASSKFNVSAVKTLKYAYNGSFEVDWTEYTAESTEASCNPSRTEVMAKMHVKGTLDSHGSTTAGDIKGEWTHTWSRWIFPKNAVGGQVNMILKVMNDECACGGRWVAGVERIVDAKKDCTKEEQRPKGVNSFYLCNLVTGQPGYGLYRWLSPTSYTSSAIRFDSNVGWNGKATSPPREQVPETGVHTGCDYIKWSDCSEPVTDTKDFCDTCDGLECEGCIYRHMVDKKSHKNDFGECCSCLWYYGSKRNYPWLEVPC